MPKHPAIAQKQALLANGEPWIVHPREVAKLPEFHGTDPEIILACILEAGVLDTGDILKTAIDHRLGLTVTDEAKATYEIFRRIWQHPTEEQRRTVFDRASRIATASKTRRRNFQWPTVH
jgi:(p)ppGpp synthase/HD superfamily hydrolase